MNLCIKNKNETTRMKNMNESFTRDYRWPINKKKKKWSNVSITEKFTRKKPTAFLKYIPHTIHLFIVYILMVF